MRDLRRIDLVNESGHRKVRHQSAAVARQRWVVRSFEGDGEPAPRVEGAIAGGGDVPESQHGLARETSSLGRQECTEVRRYHG
jgi:hypothetical protein